MDFIDEDIEEDNIVRYEDNDDNHFQYTIWDDEVELESLPKDDVNRSTLD